MKINKHIQNELDRLPENGNLITIYIKDGKLSSYAQIDKFPAPIDVEFIKQLRKVFDDFLYNFNPPNKTP